MRKICINISFIVAVLSCISCYDVLDKRPLNIYTDNDVWSNATLLDNFIASQYMYTPVMVGDATTLFNSWTGSPMNQDPRSTDMNYFFGNSSQAFGPRLIMDITDETKYNSDSWDNLAAYKISGIPSNGGCSEYWENAYYTLRNLNNAIANLPDSPLDAELIKLRLAECRFLRAYIFYSMVKRYGAFPMLTVVPNVDSPDEVLYPIRTSEKDVYDFIISECEDIKEDLAGQTEWGRASKWAALALESRAALYAGSIAKYGKVQLDGLLGISSSEADNYFQKSYNACQEIITKGGFKLYDENSDKVQNFKDLFLTKKNCEAIMVKQHYGTGFNSGGGLCTWSWDMMQAPNPNVWNCGNENGPYLEMVEEFEYIDGTSGKLDRDYVKSRLWTMEELWANKDPRFKASIYTNGDEWEKCAGEEYGNGKIDFHIGLRKPDGTTSYNANDSYNGVKAVGYQSLHHVLSGVTNTGFGIMKYVDPSANNMIWLCESRTDYMIFRYGEILLNMAEAAYELGKDGEALEFVNQIRKRAGINKLTSIDLDKIKHERKVELAFENHRYWDLRRWRDAEEALTQWYTGVRYVLDYETRKYWIEFLDHVDGANQPQFPESNYYFPITQARIGANSNLVENPRY